MFYLLAPYETLVAGGKPTAIVRLAKRAETSKLLSLFSMFVKSSTNILVF